MSKTNLFNVQLEINTSPLFVGAAALIFLGLKVKASEDLGKISRILIEAGYLPWLRDAAKDSQVEEMMLATTRAAQDSAGEGNEPNFEAAVCTFASELLNYYGGIFGINDGLRRNRETDATHILKSVSALRQLDHINEHLENSMSDEARAKADSIKEGLRNGTISTEEALRQAGAPEDLVQMMVHLEKAVKGAGRETVSNTEA